MSFREVRVFEVREVLRLWLRGEGLRTVERLAGVDAEPQAPGSQKLNVCVTPSGVPMSFSLSGIYTDLTGTNIVVTALSSTTVQKDFVPPSPPSAGS
jgi:hypothetical protein